MKAFLLKFLKKPPITGGIETEKEYNVDHIIKEELEKVMLEKTNELSAKYYRKIKSEFYLEIE